MKVTPKRYYLNGDAIRILSTDSKVSITLKDFIILSGCERVK